MGYKFSQLTKPDEEYENWRANWQPPKTKLLALPGSAIIEFSPYGTRGAVLTPEEASNNAMVVHDGYEPIQGRPMFPNPDGSGHLPQGTEVIYIGTAGTAILLEGRVFMRVPRAEIEMYVPKGEEVAA